MFDPNMYHMLCEQLTAPQETIEEVIQMTKDKKTMRKRRPMRVLVTVAAVCAALAITASAANPEVLEGILVTIRSSVSIGEYREEMMMDSGETVTALRFPEASVEERDGRVILTVDGEAIDITSEMKQDGQYIWEYSDEGTNAQVMVFLDENGKPQTVINITPSEGYAEESGMVMVTEYQDDKADGGK